MKVVLLLLLSLAVLASEARKFKKLTRKENEQRKSVCGIYGKGYGQNVTLTRKILNGRKAKIGDAPWAAGIMRADDKFTGTGTIISPWHVLTAAHVPVVPQNTTFTSRKEIFVKVGSLCIKHDSCDFVEYKVKHIHLLGNFPLLSEPDVNLYRGDVAVLELEEPIEFVDKRIWSACIPEFSRKVDKYPETEVYGFGTHGFADIFGKGKILVSVDEQLESSYGVLRNLQLKEKQKNCEHFLICAVGDGYKLSTCEGDSGAGLITRGEENRAVVVGTLSGGDLMCRDRVIGQNGKKHDRSVDVSSFSRLPQYVERLCECCGICQ